MIRGLWGKKIGMTQLFSKQNRAVPVTVIDVSQWLITQVKNKEQDGYEAVQLGRLRDRFDIKDFTVDWLKDVKKYFSELREVSCDQSEQVPSVGQVPDTGSVVTEGDRIDIVGTTIGRGFQGAMKRHGFSGGRASHGSKLGRAPGSLSNMRRQGRVRKGKKMPGHMGVERRTVKGTHVVRVEPSERLIFVKGSVPGKEGSLVLLRKCE